MLQIYCEKSQLQDGHTVLDGGCGWGSLSLCITHKYNNCKITGIWNSVTQKHILKSNARLCVVVLLYGNDIDQEWVINIVREYEAMKHHML
ncbi:putative (S)-coclaurine-N-methyltransferase [Helianthus annuus]|nr:putative (S)-coclaurine-N-methyltransferase [Helianthus annuus]